MAENIATHGYIPYELRRNLYFISCRLRRHLVYLGLKKTLIQTYFLNIRTRTSKIGRIFYVQSGQVRYQEHKTLAATASFFSQITNFKSKGSNS